MNFRPPYNIALDLATARDRVLIVPPGQYISQWKVSLLPAGATLRIHVGRESDGLLVTAADMLTFPGSFGDGLYASNPAQLGILSEIIIVPGAVEGL